MPERVLVIGATSRVAQDVVRLHCARGDELFLIARNEDKLRALFGENEKIVGLASADFAEDFDAEALLLSAVRRLGAVDRAIIAYGELGDQLETERSPGAAMRTLVVNFTSTVRLLIVLANFLERQGSGRIGVLSSVAGDRGRPRNYTYGAAKGALSLYLQGLRSRLYESGIAVTTIRLGPVDTPMTTHHEKNFLFAKPEAAAVAIMKAIDQRRGDVYVPGYFRWIMLVVRNLPEWLFQRFASLSGR